MLLVEGLGLVESVFAHRESLGQHAAHCVLRPFHSCLRSLFVALALGLGGFKSEASSTVTC